MFRTILPAALVVLLAPESAVADQKETAGPLEITITGNTKYTLDTGGQTADEYRKTVETAAKDGRPLPPPAVELTVIVKNKSEKTVAVWTTGDPVVMTLTLKGKGALDLDPPLAFTREFRAPRAVEIPAGKTAEFKYKSLVSGFRGAAHFAYWTEPGEYELVATFRTGISPAPPEAKEPMDGFGTITIKSAPFKITVETKK